jgi:hypothetical protein
MLLFFYEFKLEILDSVSFEMIGYLCGAVNNVGKFINYKKLIILNKAICYLGYLSVGDVESVFNLDALKIIFHLD